MVYIYRERKAIDKKNLYFKLYRCSGEYWLRKNSNSPSHNNPNKNDSSSHYLLENNDFH